MGLIQWLVFLLVLAGCSYWGFVKGKKILNQYDEAEAKNEEEAILGKLIAKGVATSLLISLVLIVATVIIFGSIVVVDAGQVGVVVRFGKPVREMQAGINFKLPIVEGVSSYNIRIQNYTMTSANNEGKGDYKTVDDSLKCPTSEGLQVGIDITLLYRLDKNKATETYRSITPKGGSDADHYLAQEIVRPAIRNIVRMSIKNYKIMEVYGPAREKVQEEVNTRMTAALAEKNIIVVNSLLRDVKFSAEYSAAINDKQIAEQKAQKKDYEIMESRKEAERKVIEAQGKANAIAEINRTLSQSPNYIQFLWADKLAEGVKSIVIPQGSNILINPETMTK